MANYDEPSSQKLCYQAILKVQIQLLQVPFLLPFSFEIKARPMLLCAFLHIKHSLQFAYTATAPNPSPE